MRHKFQVVFRKGLQQRLLGIMMQLFLSADYRLVQTKRIYGRYAFACTFLIDI